MTDCLGSHLVDALSVAALQLAVRAYGLVRDQVGAGNARLRQSVTVVDLKMKRMRNEVNCSNGKIICQKFGDNPAQSSVYGPSTTTSISLMSIQRFGRRAVQRRTDLIRCLGLNETTAG